MKALGQLYLSGSKLYSKFSQNCFGVLSIVTFRRGSPILYSRSNVLSEGSKISLQSMIFTRKSRCSEAPD